MPGGSGNLRQEGLGKDAVPASGEPEERKSEAKRGAQKPRPGAGENAKEEGRPQTEMGTRSRIESPCGRYHVELPHIGNL